MPRLVHLSTVHRDDDVRIFRKQCVTAAAAGYDVHYVCHSAVSGSAVRNGVTITSLGPPPIKRGKRMTTAVWAALRETKKLRPDIVQIHDAELIPAALWLSRQGYRVVRDVHEDLPAQVLTKDYLFKPLRHAASAPLQRLEQVAHRTLAATIVATPALGQTFADSYVVPNFPLVSEFATQPSAPRRDGVTKEHFLYVGGVAERRGLLPLLQAARLAGAKLIIAGPFIDRTSESLIQEFAGDGDIRYFPWLSRSEVADLLPSCLAGVVTFLPGPNHSDSLPNKLFEYMAMGLPVIASNFPHWQELVEGVGAGLCVDPSDAAALAEVMRSVAAASDAQHAAWGEAGREATDDRYNWNVASAAMLDCYANVLA